MTILGNSRIMTRVSVLALLACAANAQAQEESADSVEAENAGVGEIIVTAQKREQSINDVGMSISALSADTLIKQGIDDVGDLTKVIPGFSASQSQKGAPVYTLRGVGFYEESLGASPAVSIYVDEVGYPVPIMAKAATLDLERVEVLKGPQGTLFGQNSTGGAINYIAAKPTSEFAAGGELSAARFGRFTAKGYVSGPLSADLRMRAAVSLEEGGAWQKSASRGDRNGDSDIIQGRILTEWTPTGRFTLLVNLNAWRDRSDSLAAALLQVTPQTPSRATPVLLAQTPVPEYPGAADWNPDADLRINQDFYQASARMDYEVGDVMQLTSLTSYAKFKQNDFRDTDGSPARVFAVTQDGRVESFSQEVRLSGEAAAGRLQWLAGGYYATEKIDETNTFDIPLTTSVRAFIPLGFAPFTAIKTPTSHNNKTQAIFGNVDLEVLDQVTIHAGARATWYSTDVTGCMRC
jgi:iron complex outermembrane receptor protein